MPVVYALLRARVKTVDITARDKLSSQILKQVEGMNTNSIKAEPLVKPTAPVKPQAHCTSQASVSNASCLSEVYYQCHLQVTKVSNGGLHQMLQMV